jgi:RNA polymerase sigma-70 factor (ECF subfamily)
VEDAGHRSFELWYRQAYGRLSTSMLALTGDRDLAADVTDEAFARAWRHWHKVSEMAAPEGWTYRVALNLVRTRSRRRRVEQRILPRLVSRPETAAPAGEVWAFVRDLPERQRQAVVLRYVGDLDELEIAEVMGVTRGTVASTLFDARHRLAAALALPEIAEERS